MFMALSACGQARKQPPPAQGFDAGSMPAANAGLDAGPAEDARAPFDAGNRPHDGRVGDASSMLDADIPPARGWHVSDGHLRMPDGRVAILRSTTPSQLWRRAACTGRTIASARTSCARHRRLRLRERRILASEFPNAWC